MKYQLTALEARVIGCLLEKQVTTPEQYPLSVNGVVTACNQKTNREPVMNLCIDSLEVRKKPGGHWIIRDLMGLDLVGLASL